MRKMATIAAVTAIGVLSVAPATYADNEAQRNFAAPLSGGQEVPAVDSQGTGVATFKVSKDGSEMSYKLNVANLTDVAASHIHCGAPETNGPVAVFLFSGVPDGAVNGTLAEGVITEPLPGNACGFADLSDLVDAMRSGDTYVNVHTLASLSGEIRGQIG